MVKSIHVHRVIVLGNGRVCTHKQMDNGAADVVMADGGDMSVEEWEEYCVLLRADVKRERDAKSAAA